MDTGNALLFLFNLLDNPIKFVIDAIDSDLGITVSGGALDRIGVNCVEARVKQHERWLGPRSEVWRPTRP